MLASVFLFYVVLFGNVFILKIDLYTHKTCYSFRALPPYDLVTHFGMSQNESKMLAKIKHTGSQHTSLPNTSANATDPPLILASLRMLHFSVVVVSISEPNYSKLNYPINMT